MLATLKRMIARYKARRRERAILRTCGCVCYCPNCKDPLNDQAKMCVIENNLDGHRHVYHCQVCGHQSAWLFGVAPVPFVDTTCHPADCSPDCNHPREPITPDSSTNPR